MNYLPLSRLMEKATPDDAEAILRTLQTPGWPIIGGMFEAVMDVEEQAAREMQPFPEKAGLMNHSGGQAYFVETYILPLEEAIKEKMKDEVEDKNEEEGEIEDAE